MIRSVLSGGVLFELIKGGTPRTAGIFLWLFLPIAIEAQDFTWTTNNGTITITQYTNWFSVGSVTVPSTITGLPVTSIGAGAFYIHTNVLGVTIPDSVTNIGDQAFQYCQDMRSINLGQGITQIGDQAFSACYALDSVVIPDAVVGIGIEAFSGSGLTNVVIPGRVPNIRSNAFNCYALQSATVGSGVTNIESNAFAGSGALTSIYFLGNAPTADSTVFYGQPTIVYYLAGTTGWGSTFAGRPAYIWGTQAPAVTVDAATQITTTNATITGTVNPNGLPTAFRVEWGLTAAYGSVSIYVPVTVQSTPVAVTNRITGLSPNMLYHYRLTATNGVGQSVSADMTLTTAAGPPPPGQIPTVTLNGVISITSSNATITGTINPNGLFTGYYVQWGPSTGYGQFGPVLTLPAQNTPVAVTNSMIGLSPNTSYHYQLVGTNDAGKGYSADMTLTTSPAGPPIPTPPTVSTDPATGVTATNATINGTVNPNGLVSSCYFQWGTSTAYGNTLPPVSLPADSTALGTSAGLSGLSPSTTYHYRLVATNSAGISTGADQSFTTLPFTLADNGFTYVTNNETITITGYTGPGGDVVIPSSINGLPVTSIGDGAFYSLNNLTGVTIPDCVTNLGEAAFAICPNLATISIGKGITTIKAGVEGQLWGTFFGCSSLTRVAIPDSVTNLEDGILTKGGPMGAFADCTSLTNVVVGKGLAYLGDGTFTWCVNLLGVFFQGNAPVFSTSCYPVCTTPFFNATNVIVYYLPETTGWGPMVADRPAVLWNPQAQTGDSNFGMKDGGFGFNITGTVDIPLVVEGSANPSEGGWTPLQTCTLTNGSLYFSDSPGTNTSRFYRIRSP